MVYYGSNYQEIPETIELQQQLQKNSPHLKVHLAAAENLQSYVTTYSELCAHLADVEKLYYKQGYDAKQISTILGVGYEVILQDMDEIEKRKHEEDYNVRKASLDRKRFPPYGSAAGVSIFHWYRQ